MIADLKKCITLYKHGNSAKINLVACILFIVMSFLFVLVDGDGIVLGSMYSYLAVCLLTQVMVQNVLAGFVGASPLRKKIELKYVDMMNVIIGVPLAILYLLFAVNIGSYEESYAEIQIACCGLMAIVMYPYLAVAYKYFWLGVIYVVVGLTFVLDTPVYFGEQLAPMLKGNMGLAVLIYAVLLFAGMGMGHLIRRILYRHDFSRFSLGAKFKSDLQ
ncbi:MAG: hypothetical protein IJZ00_03990 [Lachnospiraceae bacterium]|nr:hypothetical protein [Lachnospiraceae bacterium]